MTNCTVCGRPTTKKCGKCGLARYCKTQCQRGDWKDHKKICKYPFEIRASEGKGLGLFATRDLEIGDLIVCEDPVLYFDDCVELLNPRKFQDVYEKLGRSEKDQILDLAGRESDATFANQVMKLRFDSSSIDEEW